MHFSLFDLNEFKAIDLQVSCYSTSFCLFVTDITTISQKNDLNYSVKNIIY